MCPIKAAWHSEVIFGAVIVGILLLGPFGQNISSRKVNAIFSPLWQVTDIVNLYLQCVWIISSLTASQLFLLGCKLEFIFHSVHCFAVTSVSNVWHFKNSLIYSAVLYFTICRGIVSNNRKWKFEFSNNETEGLPFHGSLSHENINGDKFYSKS